MRILITGAGGYIGSLLTTRLMLDPSVEEIVALDSDLSRVPESWRLSPKVTQVCGRLDDAGFVDQLQANLPIDAVIHAAFRLRAGYSSRGPRVAQANVESARNVFNFCFDHSIGRLVYFSSAAVYGARAENRASRFFLEEDPLREERYAYGVQKRIVEELLQESYSLREPATVVFVLRPCSVTGPQGQRFATKTMSLISFIKGILPVIPELSPEWARQFLHEEDLVRVVRQLLVVPSSGLNVFNLAPQDYLTAAQMANVLRKRLIRIPAWFAQFAFFSLWHGTRGRIPTGPGSINSFRYPINMDGRKICQTGFEYHFNSSDALLAVNSQDGQ